jgi:hypothetical protein
LNILGLKERYELSDHIQFINVLDKQTQQNLSPVEVVELLKAGNERFVNGKWNEKYFRHQVNATSMGQNPMAVIIRQRTNPTHALRDADMTELANWPGINRTCPPACAANRNEGGVASRTDERQSKHHA